MLKITRTGVSCIVIDYFCHFIVSIHKITIVIDLKQLKMDYNPSFSYIGKIFYN